MTNNYIINIHDSLYLFLQTTGILFFFNAQMQYYNFGIWSCILAKVKS